MTTVIIVIVPFFIGIVIGFMLRNKAAEALRKSAHDILEKSEANLAEFPQTSILRRISAAEEFILITKGKDGQFYADSFCQKETMAYFCPTVKNYFESTDGAIADVHEIIHKN